MQNLNKLNLELWMNVCDKWLYKAVNKATVVYNHLDHSFDTNEIINVKWKCEKADTFYASMYVTNESLLNHNLLLCNTLV